MKAIYAIRLIGTDRVYVGSSIQLARRFRTHRNDLRKGIHHSQPLQRAWDKYGEAAFEFIILEKMDHDDLPEIEAAELRWMGALACWSHSGRGFNVAESTGQFRSGKNPRMAEIKREWWAKMTPEDRATFVASRPRGTHTPERRTAISEQTSRRNLGNQYGKGKTKSAALRARLSELARVQRAGQIAAGQHRDIAIRSKQAVKSRSMWKTASAEMRAKMLTGLRKRWERCNSPT